MGLPTAMPVFRKRTSFLKAQPGKINLNFGRFQLKAPQYAFIRKCPGALAEMTRREDAKISQNVGWFCLKLSAYSSVDATSSLFPAIPQIIPQIQLQRIIPRLRYHRIRDRHINKGAQRLVISYTKYQPLPMITGIQHQSPLTGF